MKNSYQFDLIAGAIMYLKENQSQQPTLDDVAQHVHLSKFHFQRMFKKWAGVSPKEFLQYINIESAKKSLILGRSTLETAYEIGLSGNGRLHDLFVKMEACSPGEFQKRGVGMQIYYNQIETPFGLAAVAETTKGIHKIHFLDQFTSVQKWVKETFPSAILKNEMGPQSRKLEEYFDNWKIPLKELKLDLKCTPFQLQVWKALLQIPSGQLLSYQDIANQIQNPKSVRAVGTAIGKNPVAYLIPCHRVIKSNGEIGQYHWGAGRKIAMNGFENLNLSEAEKFELN